MPTRLNRLAYVVGSGVLALMPFAFGLVAALRRHDFRMLILGATAAVTTSVLLTFLRRRPLGFVLGAVVVAGTLAGVAVAYAMGARALFGVVAVALVISLCLAGSAFFGVLARSAAD